MIKWTGLAPWEFEFPHLQLRVRLFQRPMPLSQRCVPLLKISVLLPKRAISQLQPPMPLLQLPVPPSQRLVLLFQLHMPRPKSLTLA